ncbi:MAG: hypothetical protein O7A63_03015, partial [Acidobacteria bacterium]|nr:hypothetical protein [Acidobacteriota bacterium]
MRSICDRIIRYGLASLIAFTPIAFGTVERWSIAIMEWGVITLVLVFEVRVLWPDNGVPRMKVRRTGLEIPLVLFLLYAVLQTVPVPIAWLEVLSPGSVDLYDRADLEVVTRQEGRFESRGGYAPPQDDPLLKAGQPERRPISVNAGKTLERARLLAVFMALFYLVAIWCDRDDKVVFLLSSITVVGFL